MKILGDSPIYSIKANLGFVKVELHFMDTLMILAGDSANGKTWMFQKLSKRSDAAELVGDINGISLKYFDEFSKPEEVLACTRRVVVIDEAHLIDNGELVDDIVRKTDRARGGPGQIYVLISRAVEVSGIIEGAVELEQVDDVIRFSFPLVDPEDITYE